MFVENISTKWIKYWWRQKFSFIFLNARFSKTHSNQVKKTDNFIYSEIKSYLILLVRTRKENHIKYTFLFHRKTIFGRGMSSIPRRYLFDRILLVNLRGFGVVGLFLFAGNCEEMIEPSAFSPTVTLYNSTRLLRRIAMI